MYFFFLCVFKNVAFSNGILDVNSKKSSAKVLLKDNDLLGMSASEAGKQLNLGSIDVSSEKSHYI